MFILNVSFHGNALKGLLGPIVLDKDNGIKTV